MLGINGRYIGLIGIVLFFSISFVIGQSSSDIQGIVRYNPGGYCSPVGKLTCDYPLKNLMECYSDGSFKVKQRCTDGCGYDEQGVGYCLPEKRKNITSIGSLGPVLLIILIIALIALTIILSKKKEGKRGSN